MQSFYCAVVTPIREFWPKFVVFTIYTQTITEEGGIRDCIVPSCRLGSQHSTWQRRKVMEKYARNYSNHIPLSVYMTIVCNVYFRTLVFVLHPTS